ncbi:MAG: cytochrome c-type biogenesis protein CcmH [Candidatus Bipolaricaulia bacterium]
MNLSLSSSSGKALPVTLILLIFLASTPVSDIEDQLICQCGCTMVVSSCQCSVADEMRAEIAAKLEMGITSGQIIQGFVDRYGEAVLSAPTKRGFNLTAWVTPFVAVVAGLVLLYFIVRGLVSRGGQLVENRPPASANLDEETRARIREEIDEELKGYM